MPWQGNADNLIDRFDVRAHLDYIPPLTKSTEPESLGQEERQCNYESFRILAQNDFIGIGEDKFLHQLHLEEQFGVNAQQLEYEKSKKKSSSANSGGAAIGYTYEDDSYDQPSCFNSANIIASAAGGNAAQEESDSDIDVDVAIDINKLDTQQAHELNTCGRQYGMQSNDFYSFLTKDADEAESLRMAREEEQEKIMLCGRKSRRERRAQREKRFAGRPISPPSYAAKEESSKLDKEEKNDSDSRSPTPENSGKVCISQGFSIMFVFDSFLIINRLPTLHRSGAKTSWPLIQRYQSTSTVRPREHWVVNLLQIDWQTRREHPIRCLMLIKSNKIWKNSRI